MCMQYLFFPTATFHKSCNIYFCSSVQEMCCYVFMKLPFLKSQWDVSEIKLVHSYPLLDTSVIEMKSLL